jgi:hypothetical protein
MKKLEVGLLEKSLCWTNWIRGIGDYNVVGCLVLGKELESVANEDLDARRVEQRRHVREVFL